MTGTAALAEQADIASEAVARAVAVSPADMTTATVFSEQTSLTRMAGLRVHQHVTEITRRIYVRAVWDGREAHVHGDDLSESGIERLLLRSREAAAQGRKATLPGELATSSAARQMSVASSTSGSARDAEAASAIADLTDRDRTLMLLQMRDVFRRSGTDGAGNVKQQLATLAYGDSTGARRIASFPNLSVISVALDAVANASGYQCWAGGDLQLLDIEELAGKAAIRCLLGRHPKLTEPESVPVILEPAAVAQLLFHLNFRSLGLFGARSAIRKQNIVYDHIGQQLTSKHVTLVDDTHATGMIRVPFDFEGLDRVRLPLIEAGVVQGIAHDLSTARTLGASSTGHALPKAAGTGPTPQHLVMAAGDTSAADIIASTERGLLVSRLHGFVSPLSGKQGFLSGTTRDGVFLVERGKITTPIRNLRWRDRIFEAFSRIDAVSTEREMHFTDELPFPTQTLVPTVRLSGFNFVDAQRWAE